MVKAQERNIGRGAADLREQFAFSGNLKGSPFGQAMVDYQNQATAEQNALLGQLSMGAQEAARGRQFEASNLLFQGASQLASALQSLDQDSIQATLSEFVRTQPEYGPLLNMMFALATTFPPTISESGSFGLGATGALLSGAGSAAGGIADIIGILKGAGGAGGG
jgi:hypothetical protein